MAGPAPVESSHGLERIKEIFMEESLGGPIIQGKKAAWHHLCLVKAGVEVYTGGKLTAEGQHTKLRECYDRWARSIMTEDNTLGVLSVPSYVTEKMWRMIRMNQEHLRIIARRDFLSS